MDNIFGQTSFADMFGDEFDFEPEVTVPKKEPAKKKAKSSKSAKKEKVMHVTLPVTVYAASFEVQLHPADGESEGTVIDGTELLERLQNAGYSEVSTSFRSLFIPEDNGNIAYIVSSSYTAPTSSDTLIDFSKDVEFAYGMKKVSYTAADFEGDDVDPEDISMREISEKIIDAFPEFKETGFCYDVEAAVIVPLQKANCHVADSTKVSLPVTVSVMGEDVLVTEENFDGECTSKDLVAFLSKKFARPELTVKLYNAGEFFFLEFTSTKALSGANSSLKKNKGASAKKKEEKYPATAEIYMCFNGFREHLTPEMFGGNEKITKQDIIEFYKPRFAIFSSAEKLNGLKVFYDDKQNLLSVECTPGTRGALAAGLTHRRYDRSWDYEETDRYAFPDASKAEVELLMTNTSATTGGVTVSYGPYNGSVLYANRCMCYFHEDYGGEKSLVGVHMKIPKIPKVVYNNILTYFRSQLPNEAICRVVYDHAANIFFLEVPDNVNADRVRVNGSFPHLTNPNRELVVTIHSHNTMPAYFSSVDDAAESDMIGLFGVIGKLNSPHPEIKLRAAYESSFLALSKNTLFE